MHLGTTKVPLSGTFEWSELVVCLVETVVGDGGGDDGNRTHDIYLANAPEGISDIQVTTLRSI